MGARNIATILQELEEHIQNVHSEEWKALETLKRRLLSEEACVKPEAPHLTEATSLIRSIEQIFLAHPGMTWSVVTLEKQLRKRGFIFQAANPRSSLNTALRRLQERDFIVIAERGSGRRASRYKAFPTGNAASLQGRYAAIEDPTLTNLEMEAREVDEDISGRSTTNSLTTRTEALTYQR